MREYLNTRIIVAVNLFLLFLVIVVASFIFHKKQEETAQVLTANIRAQQAELVRLAELTDRNGADALVEEIVSDCTNRTEFEQLLVSLGTLNQRDLLKTQQLFASCGDFFAVRKGFMVSRLAREHEVLDEYVAILLSLHEEPRLLTLSRDWKTLVSLERDRSNFLSEQVVLQEQIITEFIKGARLNSAPVAERLNRALDISEQLQVLDQQIDAVRADLIGVTL